MKWAAISVGCLLVVAWFACWAVTVEGPANGAAGIGQWAVGNALAFFAGAAFATAAHNRKSTH
jgi:hypothetical protein